MWIIVAAAIAALIVAAIVVLVVRWWTWRPVSGKRVMVQSGPYTFEGVLLSRRGPLLVLASVTVRSGDAAEPAAGTVVIERRQVDWMQVL